MSDFPSPPSASRSGHEFSKTRQPFPCQTRLGDTSLGGCRGRDKDSRFVCRQEDMLGLKIQTSALPELCISGCRVCLVGVACVRCVCGSRGGELCIPGSCEPGCSGSGGMGACVEFSPSREIPLPPTPPVSPPLPPKFGARARPGIVGVRTAGPPPAGPEVVRDAGALLTPPPRLLQRGRFRLSEAGVRRWQHPPATLLLSAERGKSGSEAPAPLRPLLCEPLADRGGEGWRRGPAGSHEIGRAHV